MAKNPPEGSPNIFPALRYKNAPAALEWLGRAFGFEKQMVVPGPEGTIAHAQMKLGPGVIMLGSGKHGPGTDNPWDTVKLGVYVYVEDVDAHYARAKAAGAAYHQDGERLVAAVVVIALPGLEVVEQASAEGRVTFPYVPGLFGFREAHRAPRLQAASRAARRARV